MLLRQEVIEVSCNAVVNMGKLTARIEGESISFKRIRALKRDLGRDLKDQVARLRE